MNFEKNVQKGGKGGGVIFNPKNVIANLRKLTLLTIFCKKAQCNFKKLGERGLKAVWTFSKKTSKSEITGTPY